MSLKTGFAQIFSCCPKLGGAAAPLAPPRPVGLWPVVLFQKRFNSLLPVHVQLKYFKMLPTASKRNGIQIHTSKTVVCSNHN